MPRPRVICHMMSSVDGRIIVDKWPVAADTRRQYELVHASFGANAWICGRVTMEAFAKRSRSAEEVERLHDGAPRADYRAPNDAQSFAFAVDAAGRLDWQASDIDGDHVVAIVSARVSNEYLETLRARGVSYLLAGEREIDLAVALQKIGDSFGVRTLLLEGGGKINGALLKAGLIDELSLLIAPVADARAGLQSIFDVTETEFTPGLLTLQSVERRDGDVVWVRYRVRASHADLASGVDTRGA